MMYDTVRVMFQLELNMFFVKYKGTTKQNLSKQAHTLKSGLQSFVVYHIEVLNSKTKTEVDQ